MADEYYIRRNDKITGPHTLESVKAAAKARKLTSDDLIGSSKDGPWKKMKLPTNDPGGDNPEVRKETETSTSEGGSVNSKLSTCEDCGGKVSKRADNCPHCGSPLLDKIKVLEDEGSLASRYSSNDDNYLPPLPLSPRETQRRRKKADADEAEDHKKTKSQSRKPAETIGKLRLFGGVLLVFVVTVVLVTLWAVWPSTDPVANYKAFTESEIRRIEKKFPGFEMTDVPRINVTKTDSLVSPLMGELTVFTKGTWIPAMKGGEDDITFNFETIIHHAYQDRKWIDKGGNYRITMGDAKSDVGKRIASQLAKDGKQRSITSLDAHVKEITESLPAKGKNQSDGGLHAENQVSKNKPQEGDYVTFLNKRLMEADTLARNGKHEDAKEIWRSIIDVFKNNKDTEAQVKYASARLSADTPGALPWEENQVKSGKK